MNFILKFPPLKHIALANVAASFWNQHDIRDLMTAFFNSQSFHRCSIVTNKKEWQMIENKVSSKVMQLAIPTSLTEEILVFIVSTGRQILIWMNYHVKYCQLHLNLPHKFCWEPHGTINKKETAKILIQDDNIEIITRYKLACIYCLEGDILKLKQKMSESDKEFLHIENKASTNFKMELHDFWGLYITGEIDLILRIDEQRMNLNLSPYQYAFELAVNKCNKTAVEYFLQKLDLKSESLLRTVNNIIEMAVPNRDNKYFPLSEYRSEVLCFLLSRMTEEQQVEVYKTNPLQVLCNFLTWPWQNFFLNMSDRVWKFLNKEDYCLVFKNIVCEVYTWCNGYIYKNLFHDLWQQISDADRSFIINDNNLTYVLDDVLELHDKENIKLIFQSATPAEKNKFVFSKRVQSLFRHLIYFGEWDMLKFLIQLVISSKDEMIQFKKVVQCGHRIREQRLYKNKIDEFSHIIDDFVLQYDKRCVH